MLPESNELIDYLLSLENKKNQEGMKRFAIGRDNTIGISIPELRALAKLYRKHSTRHQMAIDLWSQPHHECKLLAVFIADPKQFSDKQMDTWVAELYSWDLCDQACANLFRKTPNYIDKAFVYSFSEHEFVKRCGFVLMLQYALHEKKSPDSLCSLFLQRIMEEATDDRNFVKKAVNWCLRQIGKRNEHTHAMAMACIDELLQKENKTARWIASNALRELQSSAVMERVKKKSHL